MHGERFFCDHCRLGRSCINFCPRWKRQENRSNTLKYIRLRNIISVQRTNGSAWFKRDEDHVLILLFVHKINWHNVRCILFRNLTSSKKVSQLPINIGDEPSGPMFSSSWLFLNGKKRSPRRANLARPVATVSNTTLNH